MGSDGDAIEAKLAKFKDFIVRDLGRKDSTAESYVEYVRSAGVKQNPPTKDPFALVCDDSAMAAALAAVDGYSNLKTGLRTLYLYVHKRKYGRPLTSSQGDAAASKADASWGEIPSELKEQMNDLELRLMESMNTTWNSMIQILLVLVSVVPGILLGTPLCPWMLMSLGVSLLIGVVGLFAASVVIRRPQRRLEELFRYGESLARGEETADRFSPSVNTCAEAVCAYITIGALVLASSLALAVMVGKVFANLSR